MSAERTQQMQELISRLPKSDTYPFRSVINPEYNRHHIALSLTPANLLLAMHRAREAQSLAVSWRDFRVGAAIVGLDFEPSRFQIMTGANIKPDPESSVNVHAEQSALQKARDRKFKAVSMVVVVGETQNDQQSGHEMHTLHPCGLCRDAMSEDPMVDEEATLIASALPSFQTVELYDLKSLRSFHENDPNAQIARFNLPPLKMFEPVVETGEPIRLEDDDETLAEEKVWNDSIGAYLTRRRFDILSSLES